MKKVLALVLAVVLTFGMASVGFAITKAETPSGGIRYYSDQLHNFGTTAPSRKSELNLGTSKGAGTSADIDATRWNEVDQDDDGIIELERGVTDVRPAQGRTYSSVKYGLNTSNSTNGSEVDNRGTNSVWYSQAPKNWAGDFYAESTIEWVTDDDGFLNADEELKIYLNPFDFGMALGFYDYYSPNNAYIRTGTSGAGYVYTWNADADDYLAPAYDKLTTSKLSSGNITVKRKISKGSDLIKTVEFKNDNDLGTVYIKVETVDPFVSTSEKDVDFTIYLAHKGSKIAETEIDVYATMRNPEIEVDGDQDEVNLSEGAYAKATDYNKNIEIDTGNGMFVKTKMFDGKKYYAKSVQDHITATDDELIAKYPEIDTIYTLYTVNMNSAGNEVTFDIDDRYFVYNADGKYIGTTADKLPMSNKYYLATKQIDIDGDYIEDPADDGVPVDPSNPSTGGDDVPANANDNPGTGR